MAWWWCGAATDGPTGSDVDEAGPAPGRSLDDSAATTDDPLDDDGGGLHSVR